MAQMQSSKQVLTSVLSSLSTLQPIQPIQPTQPTTTTTTLPPPPQSKSPLQHLAEEQQTLAKNVLLTLHFLFPHELLPALDILDRGLVTHLSCPSNITNTTTQSPIPTTNQPSPQPQPQIQPQAHALEVHYVQSSSSATSTVPTKSRFRNALPSSQVYEVRLDSWNCTCPAFAYAALRLILRGSDIETAAAAGAGASASAGAITNVDMHGDGHVQSEENMIPKMEDSGSGKEREWLFGGTVTKDDATVPVCKHILAVALGRAAPGLFGHGVVAREVEREELAGWAAGWGEH